MFFQHITTPVNYCMEDIKKRSNKVKDGKNRSLNDENIGSKDACRIRKDDNEMMPVSVLPEEITVYSMFRNV